MGTVRHYTLPRDRIELRCNRLGGECFVRNSELFVRSLLLHF